MPKKSTTTRSAAPRNKPQKSFELVRETGNEQALENETSAQEVSTVKAVEEAVKETSAPGKGSAAARMAARRLSSQRVQQRNATALVTPEHFAYVRKDLITIAILASLMFATIIVLYFVLAARA